MRYMLLLYTADRDQISEEERLAVREEYYGYTDELRAAGVYLAADALHDPGTATSVRVEDGERLATDGPFAETREWLGGYFAIECDDLDQALDWAARCPNATRGTVEVRPIIDLPGIPTEG